MHILVIAEACPGRRALVRGIVARGHEFAVACAAEAAKTTRRSTPDVVVIDAPSEASAAAILERVRGAAERAIAAIQLLPEGAVRLRLPAVRDGITALPRVTDEDGLAAALSELEPYVRGHARPRRVQLRLESERGVIRAHDAEVAVTRSERALLDELLREPGSVVSLERLVAAIWRGRRRPSRADAALRTHVSTARRKLREVAPEAEIVSRPGIGYLLRDPHTRNRRLPG